MGGKKVSKRFLIKPCYSGLLGHTEHFEHKREDVQKLRAHMALSGSFWNKKEDTQHTLQAINSKFNLGALLGTFLLLPSGSGLPFAHTSILAKLQLL